MRVFLHLFLVSVVLPLRQFQSCPDDQCRILAFPPTLFFVGERLVNHTVRNTSVIDRDTCEYRCYLDYDCVSVNFYFGENGAEEHNCELNNSTAKEHDKDLVEAANYVYHGTKNFCAQSPCKNNGTCHSGFTRQRFRCLCASGFTGHDCDVDIDECSNGDHLCDVNANCTNTDGSYNCTCREEYIGDGQSCQDRKGNTCGPVGVADNNTIPDARMSASSVFFIKGDLYASYLGRLNETRGRGGWCPKTKSDRTDYLQVDMGSVLSVCAVATQGGEELLEWTTSYKLRLSIDGLTWNTYEETNKTKVFQGNSDRTSIVRHSLGTDFKARYVRFYPVSHHHYPCLRVEIYVLK